MQDDADVDRGAAAGRGPAARVPSATAGIPPVGPAVDLRLDGNQGRAPGAAFWQQLGRDGELLAGYPHDRALEQALAQRFAVPAERVVIGAGADELLDRLCRAVLQPGRQFVLPVPTFEMLSRYATLAEGELVPVPWLDGPYPRQAVLAAIGGATALVAIVSPNNPTGLSATAADVAAVARAAPHALVLVDAAYAEFADEDLSAAALLQPNAVLVRTFSKAWGLAGLRVGHAIAPPAVARWLRAAGSPFTAGRLQRHAAAVRLATGGDELAAYVADVRRERQRLIALLAGLGLQPLPSQGNFVFVRGGDGELLRDALAGLGIAVRAFTFADGSGSPPGVRITLPGDERAFARLAAALTAACRPAALVLDLDGVLADVARARALAEPSLLAALAARLPVAVVTGCGRVATEAVLRQLQFAPHVRAVVTADDGPGKPDAFPVRRALQLLGAGSGWMLGDHVVDVRAARAAGVVPFAVTPHGACAAAHAADLRAAGAARLIDGLGALLPLLDGLPAAP